MLPSLVLACGITTALTLGPPLPGTQPLVLPDDLVAEHLKQVQGYFLRRIAAAEHDRQRQWQGAMEPHRTAVRGMLGIPGATTTSGPTAVQTLLAGKTFRVERVSIGLGAGRAARGLLVVPRLAGRRPLVVVCPDADTWPERMLGLDSGRTASWLAGLVAGGATVYVPQSIERLRDHPYCQTTNGKDRRMILYRLGYVVGRSMPGLDVEELLAAVAALTQREDVDPQRIAVVGLGQGGMTALFAAALDRRFAAAVVADYFQRRDRCWQEPVDRRLPGQLLVAGDAELAALVAPRRLALVASAGWGPPEPAVRHEFARVSRYYQGLHAAEQCTLEPCVPAQDLMARAVGLAAAAVGLPGTAAAMELRPWSVPEPEARRMRDEHFAERLRWLRGLVDASEAKRQARWNLLGRCGKGDRHLLPERPDQPSVGARCFAQKGPVPFSGEFPRVQAAMLADYRQLVGEVPTAGTPLRPRSELILETTKFRAYRVMLDVTAGVEVYGHLLIPNGARARLPALVCQHGLSGRPEMITGIGHQGDTPYHAFGARLAERGYVVFAPLVLHYHPVEWTNDQVRQADAVGMMRVAMVIAQTQRVVDFLQSLDAVDPKRIGYYGLSYGGYSALWVPPLVDRLSAVVVSGHFNDWRSKITADYARTSYLLHPDEDFYNWDVLDRFTHVELVMMTAPRAVCIEYGRRDGITTPEWTAYAWRQLRAIRDHLGLADRMRMAEFDGVHEVHGVESFSFLDEILQ